MLLLSLNLGGQAQQPPHVVDGSKRRRRLYLGPEDQPRTAAPAEQSQPQAQQLAYIELPPEPQPRAKVQAIEFAPAGQWAPAITWPERMDDEDDHAAMAAAEALLM